MQKLGFWFLDLEIDEKWKITKRSIKITKRRQVVPKFGRRTKCKVYLASPAISSDLKR